MLFAAIVWGKRINMQRISNHGFTPSLLKLTARQYSKERLRPQTILGKRISEKVELFVSQRETIYYT
jgi:hypothetical protein